MIFWFKTIFYSILISNLRSTKTRNQKIIWKIFEREKYEIKIQVIIKQLITYKDGLFLKTSNILKNKNNK